MSEYGIVIVSHVAALGEGLARLVEEVASDVPVTVAAGLADGGVGTDFNDVLAAIEGNEGEEVLAFFDLGSAKMNLEMAKEMTDKPVHLYNVALVEGCYNAAALLQVNVDLEAIEETLEALTLNK